MIFYYSSFAHSCAETYYSLKIIIGISYLRDKSLGIHDDTMYYHNANANDTANEKLIGTTYNL
jgi:hypothetical protein